MPNPLISKFVFYLEHERNFSAHTIRCYATDLSHFAAFLLGPQAAPDAAMADGFSDRLRRITPLDLRAYLGDLKRADYSRATIARKIATLRSFYKFLARQGEVPSNPVKVIRTPRQEKRLPKFLAPAEVERLLATPKGQDLLSLRDVAMLEVLYSSGIRVSELVGLDLEDVDPIGEVARVRGKDTLPSGWAAGRDSDAPFLKLLIGGNGGDLQALHGLAQ